MALSKLTQDKIISESLKKEFGDKYIFEPPILYNETDENVFFLNIETSNLGRTSVTRPKITFKQIENVINPILDKHNIIYSKWSSGMQNPKTWKEDLSYLQTDTEEELFKALEKIIPYIKDYCIPFWEKYQHLNEVLILIDNYSEQELNQGIFQGFTGIMLRLSIAYIGCSDYYSDKKEFYQKIIKEYSKKKPEQYFNLYSAFTELIETLENSTNKPV